MFGKQTVPAVGVSLGVERILVVMEELGMLPEVQTLTRVYVTVFSDASLGASQRAATAFRAAGIPSQVALKGGKLGRQFKHAGALGIPWVVVVGEREAAAASTLREMATSVVCLIVMYVLFWFYGNAKRQQNVTRKADGGAKAE